MKTVSPAAVVAAALLLGQLGLGAQSAKLRYVTSAYADDKGVGLKWPEGVACDAKGQLVVGDTGNDRMVRFTYRDQALSAGSEIKIPELSAPSRVQLDSKGDIYALDGKVRRIVRLGADGTFKGAVSFDGLPPPSTVVVKSFRIDAADNVYVLDVFSSRVLVLNAAGQFQRALALPDEARFVSDLAVDTAGNVLALDSIGRRLFSAGKDATTFVELGKDLSESLLTIPAAIATGRGIIFVVEASGSSIVSFGRDGSFLARQLTEGWKEGALNHPAQMCVNDKDEAFIADRDNSRIQVFGLIR